MTTTTEPPTTAGPVELPWRERECLDLLARGLTNRQIGRELHLSTDAVKTRMSRLYRSLGVHNRAHAVVRAYELGLLTLDGA